MTIRTQDTSNLLAVDLEFAELREGSPVISVGACNLDVSNYFYAEIVGSVPEEVDSWIRDNVVTKLFFLGPDGMLKPDLLGDDTNEIVVDENGNLVNVSEPGKRAIAGSRQFVAEQFLAWLDEMEHEQFTVLADVPAYDWVKLVNLLTDGGSCMDLTKKLNIIVLDLATMLYCCGIDPDSERESLCGMDVDDEKKHNALYDARIVASCFNTLNTVPDETEQGVNVAVAEVPVDAGVTQDEQSGDDMPQVDPPVVKEPPMFENEDDGDIMYPDHDPDDEFVGDDSDTYIEDDDFADGEGFDDSTNLEEEPNPGTVPPVPEPTPEPPAPEPTPDVPVPEPTPVPPPVKPAEIPIPDPMMLDDDDLISALL